MARWARVTGLAVRETGEGGRPLERLAARLWGWRKEWLRRSGCSNFTTGMEWLTLGFHWIGRIVDLFGLLLLTVGFARGAVGWIRLEWQRLPWTERLGPVRELRRVVAVHILYALELMIVSDIIASFLAIANAPEHRGSFFESEVFASLVELAMVVGIRTVIDFFLEREAGSLAAER